MTGAEAEVDAVVHAWDVAMIGNDADEIGQFMSDDWTIVGSDGTVSDKGAFLGLIRSGQLTHDVMESDDIQIRLYGDAAVVLARGVSGGKFQGRPFHFVERVSCVFIRQNGRWRCVSTHLSQITGK